jgi:photosystem II stability/assembly factor-like uncharacterized protein
VARRKKRPARRTVERPEVAAVPKRTWVLLAVLTVSAAAAAAVVVALARGEDDGTESAIRDLVATTDPRPGHIHGLGVNPADGSLFIATHAGTYRVPRGSREAQPVGESRQDTMGFTVVGSNRFLGSGHPDPRAMREENLPPNLGLIESRDGGRTWVPVSLVGEADFHVLRARGVYVYGFDATSGRLLASADGGRTWSRRATAEPLIDLVLHPQRPSQLVAATPGGLTTSPNGGRSWRALGNRFGLLAWPVAARLLLVDTAGQVFESRDAGRRWRPQGNVGGQPAAFVAESAEQLYVALHDGTVKRSRDGGASWEVRLGP